MYKSIRPGKTWYDTNGNRIQAHGGSILYTEGKFWWYGETKPGLRAAPQASLAPTGTTV